MTADLGPLLPIALEAVGIASELVRESTPGAITGKGDRDMVSEADYTVERALRELLHERTPDINVLGEEEGVTGRLDSGLTWALDPIDGTANFVHGLPLCAVSLGLIQDGRPVLGVIDLPFLGTRYTAVENGGAHNGSRRLCVSQTSDLRDAIVAVGDYAVGDDAERRNRLRFAVTHHLASHAQRVRMLGSAAIDLAWVADGKLDAAILFANKPWDTAAGVVLAREAGALVVDADGSPHTVDSAATIAVAAPLAEAVVAVVRDANEGVTGPQSPADPDTAAARARYLLLDLDTTVFADLPADAAAARLRAVLHDHNVDLPDSVASAEDPFHVLRYAATLDRDIAERVEAEMTDLELNAVGSAAPAPYVPELVAACRESGRFLALVSNHSARALNAYLTAHRLDGGVDLVVGRTIADQATFTLNAHLITYVATRLDARLAECAIVSDSPACMDAAHLAGIGAIGYADDPRTRERLTAAGADAIIASLGDLALRLRAHPGPS